MVWRQVKRTGAHRTLTHTRASVYAGCSRSSVSFPCMHTSMTPGLLLYFVVEGSKWRSDSPQKTLSAGCPCFQACFWHFLGMSTSLKACEEVLEGSLL